MVLRRAFLSSRVRHSRSLRHPEAPFLESPRLGNARFSQHAVDASRRLGAPHLVDASEAPADYDHSAVVYEDAISEEEHDALVSDFTARLKRCVIIPEPLASTEGEACSSAPRSFDVLLGCAVVGTSAGTGTLSSSSTGKLNFLTRSPACRHSLDPHWIGSEHLSASGTLAHFLQRCGGCRVT